MKRLSIFVAALIGLIGLSACGGAPEAGAPAGPSFEEVIATRHCVRDYDAARKISEEEVRALVKTALEAPSWRNYEESRYYVVLSGEPLEAVKNMVGANKERVSNAPVMIVSTFVKGMSGFHKDGTPTDSNGDCWGAYDCGLSNSYFVLAARAAGYDTLIMGARDEEGLRSLLGIPESEAVLSVIALGYRASEPRRPERKSVDEVAKFF